MLCILGGVVSTTGGLVGGVGVWNSWLTTKITIAISAAATSMTAIKSPIGNPLFSDGYFPHSFSFALRSFFSAGNVLSDMGILLVLDAGLSVYGNDTGCAVLISGGAWSVV